MGILYTWLIFYLNCSVQFLNSYKTINHKDSTTIHDQFFWYFIFHATLLFINLHFNVPICCTFLIKESECTFEMKLLSSFLILLLRIIRLSKISTFTHPPTLHNMYEVDSYSYIWCIVSILLPDVWNKATKCYHMLLLPSLINIRCVCILIFTSPVCIGHKLFWMQLDQIRSWIENTSIAENYSWCITSWLLLRWRVWIDFNNFPQKTTNKVCYKD